MEDSLQSSFVLWDSCQLRLKDRNRRKSRCRIYLTMKLDVC